MRIAPSQLRFLAFFFDCFFVLLFTRFVLFPFLQPKNWDLATGESLLQINLSWLGSCLFFFLFKDIFWSRSFGKWILRLKLAKVQENFPPLSWKEGVLRNFCLLFLWPIEIWRLFFEKHLRRWGDLWVGSVVLQEQKAFNLRNITHRVLILFLFFSLLWMAYLINQPWQIAQSSFYQKAREDLKTNPPTELKADYRVDYFKELYWEEKNLLLKLKLGDKNTSQIYIFHFQEKDGGWKIEKRTKEETPSP